MFRKGRNLPVGFADHTQERNDEDLCGVDKYKYSTWYFRGIDFKGIAGLELRQGSEGARRDAPRASANVESHSRSPRMFLNSQFSLPQTHMMTTHVRSLCFSIPSRRVDWKKLSLIHSFSIYLSSILSFFIMFVPIRLASQSHNSHSALAEPDTAVAMVTDSSVTLYKKRKRTLEKLDLQRYLNLCPALFQPFQA